ncbi:MAG: HK97-gp10 family putative phage morphogenesis protein [Pseudomonadota bacterium]
MTDEIRIEGLSELEDALADLGAKTGIKMIRRALLRGGREVVKAARAKVPVGTGALRRSIGISTRRGRFGSAVAVAYIGPKPRNKAAVALAQRGGQRSIKGIFYGHIVEQGSRRSRPQPFLRPALDENIDRVVGAFVGELRKGLNRVN